MFVTCFHQLKHRLKRIKFYEKNKYSITLYDKEDNVLEYESPEKNAKKEKEAECNLDFLPY